MALRFLDSVDHYNTPTQKWTTSGSNVIIAAGGARTGAQGLRFNNGYASSSWLQLTLDAQQTWIIGFAFRTPSAPSGSADLCSTFDGATKQCAVQLNPDMTLRLVRGGTPLATSTRALSLNTFYYIEFKNIIADAGGLTEVRVNEEVWATFNGDTQNTANPFANALRLKGDAGPSGTTINLDYDDIYILDGTGGAPNNDYWGDTQIEAKVPDGAGFYTEWATLVGAATHWQAVNEVPPNEDTSYIADSLLDVRDTFTFQDLSLISAQINGIQVLIRAREDVAGGVTIARMYRNAGVDNQGADTPINTSYAYYIREIMESDPIAAGPWTVGNINSAEFGVRVRP